MERSQQLARKSPSSLAFDVARIGSANTSADAVVAEYETLRRRQLVGEAVVARRTCRARDGLVRPAGLGRVMRQAAGSAIGASGASIEGSVAEQSRGTIPFDETRARREPSRDCCLTRAAADAPIGRPRALRRAAERCRRWQSARRASSPAAVDIDHQRIEKPRIPQALRDQ